MEEKAEGFEGGGGGGGGVEREMLQLWGDKTTEQHLTCGCVLGGRGQRGPLGCTQWHCCTGGGEGVLQGCS